MAKNKSQYDSTLNLPKTLFEMRAGLPKKEPVMLKDWDDNDLYNQLMKHNEGKPQFILHDGPPFSNGNIHMGHALNKALKDFKALVLRIFVQYGLQTVQHFLYSLKEYGLVGISVLKIAYYALHVGHHRSPCGGWVRITL